MFAFLDTWLILGCTSQPPHPASFSPTTIKSQDVIYEPLDDAFDSDVMEDWGVEALARFGPGVVVVGCHGFYAINGTWLVFPTNLNSLDDSTRPWDVNKLITYEEAKNPGHPLVLLCCNCDSIVLHGHPEVWYSLHDNWMEPDQFVPHDKAVIRHILRPSVVGDIKDFISAK